MFAINMACVYNISGKSFYKLALFERQYSSHPAMGRTASTTFAKQIDAATVDSLRRMRHRSFEISTLACTFISSSSLSWTIKTRKTKKTTHFLLLVCQSVYVVISDWLLVFKSLLTLTLEFHAFCCCFVILILYYTIYKNYALIACLMVVFF